MRSSRRSRLVRQLARGVVRAVRWRLEGEIPEHTRCVLVCAPHTSWWDLWATVLFGAAAGVQVSWLGKHTLFWWPNRVLLEALGGIPIRRDGGDDTVKQVVARFAEGGDLVLAISPEGAKRRRPWWRSGFWYIARDANVPIVVASLDWKRRVCRLGPTIVPTNLQDDMETIRNALQDVTPRHPELFGPIRLKSEIEGEAEDEREAG
jgi:1-acyl-sn-glycerol-3-phosphate acyltransferase